MSNKRKALGGNANDHEFGVFPYKIASLEREIRALKRQAEKDKAEIAKRYAYKNIDTKDTLNRRGNRLIVEAQMWAPRSWFPIPDNVDLENKTQVRHWGVNKWGQFLHIEYVGERDDDRIQPVMEDSGDGEVNQISLCDIEDVGGLNVDETYPDDEEDE